MHVCMYVCMYVCMLYGLRVEGKSHMYVMHRVPCSTSKSADWQELPPASAVKLTRSYSDGQKSVDLGKGKVDLRKMRLHKKGGLGCGDWR